MREEPFFNLFAYRLYEMISRPKSSTTAFSIYSVILGEYGFVAWLPI